MSTVAVASTGAVGVGDGVSVVLKDIDACVGVYRDGWKGVGVADGFGAEVTNTNGKGACSGV